MSTVTISNKDDITTIRLNNGVTNAINPAMLAELDLTLAQARENSRGLMLAAQPQPNRCQIDLVERNYRIN